MEIVSEVVFDQNFLTIYHKPEVKQIHLKWKGFANSQQYRESMNTALRIVGEKGVENWLGDLKQMQIILPQDEDWTIESWFPALAATGLKKLAIVTSMDFLNNAAVKRMVTAAQPSVRFETRYFIDVADATRWLEESY